MSTFDERLEAELKRRKKQMEEEKSSSPSGYNHSPGAGLTTTPKWNSTINKDDYDIAPVMHGVTQNKDFAEKSGYVSTKSDKFWDKLSSKYGMGYTDLEYEYINNQNGIRDEIAQRASSWGSDTGKTTSSYEEKGLDHMTKDEVAVYNYYYRTMGKERAKLYLDGLAETLAERKAGKTFSSLEGKTGKEVAYGIVAGSEQFKQGVKNLPELLWGDDKHIAKTAEQIVAGKVREDLADDGFNILGNSIAQIGFDALNTGSNMIPSIAVGMVNPAAGAALMGASAAGNAYQEDLNEFGDPEASKAYAITIGTLEGTLQYALGGIGKLGGLSPTISRAVSGIKNGALRFGLEYGGKIGSEALEEGLQEVLDPLVKNAVHGTDEKVDWNNVAYSALLGGLMGGVFGATEVSSEHFSNAETSVVSKEFKNRVAEAEKNGKKLTNRQKNKIYESVISDMKRGYISTDLIEEVLGGDKYTPYKQATDAETALKDKQKALQEEFSALGNKKNATLAEQARFNELRKQLFDIHSEIGKSNKQTEALKKQLSKSVYDSLVAKASKRGNYLLESYNERARAGEDFKADFEKFKGAKHFDAVQKTLDNAIKAGANNTNRVHDIVDFAAKIAGDTGKAFDFQSDEMIKADFIKRQTAKIAKLEAIPEAERTAEQKKMLADFKDQLAKVKSGQAKVNGSITANGIVLNLSSAKPLNRIVGHEVTHIFEPEKGKKASKEYTNLKNALYRYAKSKGVDIDKKLAEYKMLYEGVEGADPETEMIADMVGDYLFDDTDFAYHLSVQDQNLFQRIWNEIKHLAKIATAGSKEARELERVKKAFEDAYRKSSEGKEFGDNDVQYSIRKEAPPKETGIAYKVFFVKDGKLYPPMVANPDGADTPMGVWLNADMGVSAPPSKTGRAQVKAGGKGTQGGSGSLAFRPGWHLGDLPRASQFDRVNPETGKKELFPENFVWAEVEYAKDVDYQEEAMSYGYTENGKFRHSYAGLPRLPENGYYRYRTNPKPDTVPWVITGAMKVNRLLSDAEVNKILEENGVDPVHRQGGDVGLDKFGFDEDGTVKHSLTDTEGRQLSKEQQEYFKDSKVRDENGNLKVMYHGSPNGYFTVFKDGTYFTDNKEYADKYQNPGASSLSKKKSASNPKTYEVYLDIKKPFDINDAEARRVYIEDYIKGGNAVGINPYLSDAEYAKIKTIDWTEGEDLREFLIDNGYDYDGLVLDEGATGGYGDEVKSRGTSYVVFSPEQVKNIDNRKPTADPDIRYSLSETDKSYMDAVNRGDTEMAQKMVDDAAKRAGYDYRGDHRAKTEFTVFDRNKIGSGAGLQFGDGFYVSLEIKDKATADYADSAYGKRKMELYVKMQSPLKLGEPISEETVAKLAKDLMWFGDDDSVRYGVAPETVQRQLTSGDSYEQMEAIRWLSQKNGTAISALLKECGFDGIISENEYVTQAVVWDENQLKSADPITYDDSGNVIPLSQRFNTENDDIRFSLSKAVEETKELMALHNLHTNELLKQLEMGGMVYPSVAITNPEKIAHEDFGDITAVLHRDAIDPKTSKYNHIYSSDAYTPTFPHVSYEANREVAENVVARVRAQFDSLPDYYQRSLRSLRDATNLNDVLNRYGGYDGLVSNFADDHGMKQLYLAEKGESVPMVISKTETELTDYQKALYQKVVDRFGADELESLNDRGYFNTLGEARIAWTKEHLDAIKDVYVEDWSSDGTMTKAEALEVANSEKLFFWYKEAVSALNYLENGGVTVVEKEDLNATNAKVDEKIAGSDYKQWLKDLFKGIEGQSGIRNNKDTFLPSGKRRSFSQLHDPVTIDNVIKVMRKKDQTGIGALGGNFTGAAVQEYGSIAEAKRNANMLGVIDEAEYTAIKNRISDRLFDISGRYANGGDIIDARNAIIEAVAKNESKAGIERYLKQYDYVFKYTDGIADDIIGLRDYVRSLPRPYFEAKPRRAVGFDEVAVFVIPRNADVKLKQELLNRGYNIAEYDPDVEGDRQRVVNQFEEYKFSLSDASEGFTPYGVNELYGDHFLKEIAPVNTEVNTDNAKVNTEVKNATRNASVAPVTEETAPMPDDKDAPPVRDNSRPKEISTVAERIKQKIINTQRELDKNRELMQQAYTDYSKEIAKKQAVYDSKKNKSTKAAQDILRSIERMKRIRDDINADYSKRISDLEKRVEKYHSKEYGRAEHRRAKQEGYTKLWEDMIGDTSTWKDLPLGLQYKTKTLRRILRKVVKDANGNADIQKADRIYDELETKYDHNEALLKRESQKLKDVYKKLNLNHKEDTYAHMLGELRHNPDTTLTEEVVKEYYNKHKGKIDEAKVNKAISEARKTFDDLIGRVNKVLREQGFKEIPYRQGYFPHFTNPKQTWLMKAFNWKPVNNEIPTSIAGLTETFKPQRSWQSFDKQRKSDTTDYSLYQGLDTYIHGALDWIYHIEDLQKRRALENHLRFVHSDEGIKQRIQEIKDGNYDADEAQQMINAVLTEAKNPLGGLVRELMNRTNTLANKKAAADRAMEDDTNRKVYSTMTNLNNRITSNMVVGSVSSAFTNFIPIVQSWHQVSPAYSVRGLGDFIRSTVHDDGMVAKSDFLTNRLVEEEKLYQTGWDKVADKAAFLMSAFDNISAQTVWRSKYLQNLKEGMSESEAIKDADQFAKNVMAGRSRGNAPTIFDAKNPITKLFTAFQLEVANQYGYMLEDVPQDSTSKTRLVKGYATAFVGAYVYNALYSALVGRDVAFDPISIIEDLLGDLFDDEEEPEDVILNFSENILQEVPFVGGLLGGGRVPISSALPYSSDSNPFESMLTDLSEGNTKSLSKEFLKPLYYLAMPVGGGQIKKAVEGLGMFSDDHPIAGSYTDSGALRFPVEDTLGNRIQAALFGQYANKNAREYFDNGWAPLAEKQTNEFVALDIPITQYREIRKNLSSLNTLEKKLAYINSLDLPVSKKNILANNLTARKDPINMGTYGQYGSLEEYNYAQQYPEKYQFLQDQGVTYDEYDNFDDDTKDAWNYAYNNPDKIPMMKAVGGVEGFMQFAGELADIKANKDQYGKSIMGSRKEKVIEYFNDLDADYGAKLILFKKEYPADDTYNEEIIDYLNSREDISYDDMVAILEELGFRVSEDGIVTWD